MVWIMLQGCVQVLKAKLRLLLFNGHHPQVVVQVRVLFVNFQRLLQSNELKQ